MVLAINVHIRALFKYEKKDCPKEQSLVFLANLKSDQTFQVALEVQRQT